MVDRRHLRPGPHHAPAGFRAEPSPPCSAVARFTSVATALLETNREYLTIDSELTVGRMLEFAGVLRSLDPNAIASYQIESTSQNVSGQSVQIPRIKGENMQAILAIFRGEAPLAAAPDQIFESTAVVRRGGNEPW